MPNKPMVHKPYLPTQRHQVEPNRWGQGRGGAEWREKRRRVFESDNYQCRRCKARGKVTFVKLHGEEHGVCDHIKPLSDGGGDDESNLQTLCQSCDREKTAAEAKARQRISGGRGG